jgi:tRNA(adenine34) deaminase
MKVKTRFYKKNLVFAETVMLEIFFSDHLMSALIVAQTSPDGSHKKTSMTTVVESVDNLFMREALKSAQSARELGEVPIGAIIVHEGGIIGRGYNLRETSQDPTTHAEMIAIRQAATQLGSWRLLDCTLYVTLEPCVMCMGAIILARIPRLVYGCRDPRVGAAGSIYNFSLDERFNHRVATSEGVLGEECSALLSGFFQERRAEKKAERQQHNAAALVIKTS